MRSRSLVSTVESVSAIQVEEAVIARLKELANDRGLIEELILETVKGQRERTEHVHALLLSKQVEVKKIRQKVSNLTDAISEEDDRLLRRGLTEKLKELQVQLECAEGALKDLKDNSEGGSVADVGSVFSLLKTFKKGFERVDVSLQSEVLRDIVSEIEVQKEGVLVKIFVSSSGNSEKKRPAVCRSLVRSVSNLVEAKQG